MKIVNIVANTAAWNGMANTARNFAEEERVAGHDSCVANAVDAIVPGTGLVRIHGSWLPVLWRAARKARGVGARLEVRPAGSYDPVRLAYHGWKKRLVGLFERRMLRKADAVLATCAAEEEWIHAYEPSACVERTDLSRFYALDPPEATGPMRHFLYLGRRHPLKGLDILEEALRGMGRITRSVSESGGVHLRISAPRPFDVRIESAAFGADKEAAFAWCDALVLPTLSENFGIVVAEALAHGKPAVTTDGAPAWEGSLGVVFLHGYRAGTRDIRVGLLRSALGSLVQNGYRRLAGDSNAAVGQLGAVVPPVRRAFAKKTF